MLYLTFHRSNCWYQILASPYCWKVNTRALLLLQLFGCHFFLLIFIIALACRTASFYVNSTYTYMYASYHHLIHSSGCHSYAEQPPKPQKRSVGHVRPFVRNFEITATISAPFFFFNLNTKKSKAILLEPTYLGCGTKSSTLNCKFIRILRNRGERNLLENKIDYTKCEFTFQILY